MTGSLPKTQQDANHRAAAEDAVVFAPGRGAAEVCGGRCVAEPYHFIRGAFRAALENLALCVVLRLQSGLAIASAPSGARPLSFSRVPAYLHTPVGVAVGECVVSELTAEADTAASLGSARASSIAHRLLPPVIRWGTIPAACPTSPHKLPRCIGCAPRAVATMAIDLRWPNPRRPGC